MTLSRNASAGLMVSRWVGVWLCVMGGVVLAQDRPATPFSRERLLERARAMAEQPYVERTNDNEALERLRYDEYRAIRFRTSAAIWLRESRTFAVDLFYPGYLFRTPVNIHLVVDGVARPVLFTNDIFEFGEGVTPVEPSAGVAYSGFRVRAPINRADYLDEFLVFQGASYFRAVARGQAYGLSARGLAIRTARAQGEEFPAFTEFWIERPREGAERIVIHALLESPSVVGAYSFEVEPGEETIMDVDAALFPRADIDAFGIAPLTSMFLFDASNRVRFDDFREAVHDSDGLQILNGAGERIWRPLANPRTLQVSAFVDEDPRGFGLVQRKRRFDDYQDNEARYERRPSLWVEPRGAWGEGYVELVEIPTDEEIHDNIVAYWLPAVPLTAGERRDFRYRLRWLAEPLGRELARVAATRSGQALRSELRAFAIDFDPGENPREDLAIDLTSSAGMLSTPRGEPIEPGGLYRVSFELDPEREEVVELRLRINRRGRPWSETWLYRWTP